MQGYTLDTNTGKYYKPVKESVTKRQAKDRCAADGTIVVEPRTTQEFQAMKSIYGKNTEILVDHLRGCHKGHNPLRPSSWLLPL